ncbi:MAG: RsmG family class I SAM-dependent methyltransferase [Myxococcota bacterium]
MAIAFPHVTMHLVEPRRKRVTFMSIALRRLALTNVTVHEQRLDEVVAVQPGHVGTMAAKAFQNPHVWLQTAQQWLRPDGMVYMYASEASWDHNAQPPQGLRECARSPHPERSDRFGVVFEVT